MGKMKDLTIPDFDPPPKHDPLCPYDDAPTSWATGGHYCQCALISAVRHNERIKMIEKVCNLISETAWGNDLYGGTWAEGATDALKAIQ